ncbi:lytic murein transglycosylase [Enterovirga rhinocerotis]|uniref:Lytic murein transglycosylase n=1 Tax=Enterovirga rhinocerotis TaxID=1339210 RepID=A0A4R7C559_9HYPH|nr:lytic murein transglycosylase [Enterovirga rhinocerotis]TDR93183.1 lytic murein transglycosylase [Enterovirga rhinocerotis]
MSPSHPPRRRFIARSALAALLVVATGSLAAANPTPPSRTKPAPAQAAHGNFSAFVAGLWPDAQRAGISRRVFEAAMSGVTPDPKVIALTKRQSEFSKPIWDYVNNAVSAARISRARQLAATYSATLDRVESRYGVPREIVLAVWGMESGFGANTGGMSVIRSLSTLAYVRYRGDYFRDELIQALRIIQAGHVTPAGMKGSWAGAMGQTQFMPSSYAAYAVDEDGDGHPNIWTSAPDALASTANYLRQKGWQPGLPWVTEVVLPRGLDLRTIRRGYADWASLGVQRSDGRGLPRSGQATLFLPAGIGGPTFLVGENFEVIRTYNSSDAYAMGVGHLANRIGGGGAFTRAWPSKSLSHPERVEVQRRLSTLGFYRGEADGRHGVQTRESLRAFQARSGLVTDGYADFAVLKALRGGR